MHAKKKWPVFTGDYIVKNAQGFVAVATLNSPPEIFAEVTNNNVAIIGSVKTENLGIEKIIANVISNPHIRCLVVCGRESRGHFPGQALIALIENGIDEEGRIIGAKGAIPYLENMDREAVERFREQIVKLVDMRESEDTSELKKVVDELAKNPLPRYHKEPMFVKGIGKKDDAVSKVVQKLDRVVANEVVSIDPLAMMIHIEI